MPYGFSERMAEEAEKQFPPMPNIILFATLDCSRCHLLANWLDDQGIAYETKNLSDPAVLTDLRMDDMFPLEAPLLKIGDIYHPSGWLFRDGKLNEKGLNGCLEGKT